MARTKMKCHFDGKGYISNLGVSKYWGVSTCSKTGAWRIKAGTQDYDYQWLWAKFNMSEEEAAFIAASYYEKSVFEYGLGRKILSQDGKSVYIVDAGYGSITKVPATEADARKRTVMSVNGPMEEWNNQQVSILKGLKQISEGNQNSSRFFDAVIGIANVARLAKS